MLRTTALLLLFLSIGGYAQKISPARQIALNNYVEYANRSAQEVTSLFNKIVDYYPQLRRSQRGKSHVTPFACPDQLDDYYFNEAISKSPALGNAVLLNRKAKELRNTAEKLNEKCKALDTYYKLKDYQRDKFRQAEVLISETQTALAEYRQAQGALANEIESTCRKLQPPVLGNPYHAADEMMKQEIHRERAFLDSWNFNLNEETHTGWPVDELQSSILETDKAIEMLTQVKPSVKYPASGMYLSFVEALGSILTVKRSGLEGYNDEAKKSDKYSNQIYLDLINYFNGTMVSSQNGFVQYAVADDFFVVNAIRYVPFFGTRSTAKYPEKKPARDKEVPGKIMVGNAAGRKENPDLKGGNMIHDTVKVVNIVRVATRQRDTVYLEKHDTIYPGQPGNNPMSMEGYATNNLVFLLDVSGSMTAGQKLPLLKRSMQVLLTMLRPEDQVSVVVYSGKARVVLPPTSAQERGKIANVIENLTSEGETNGNAGIRLAYKVANSHYIRTGNNRIILATDGEFPISEETMNLVSRSSNEDILLSVFNFGKSSASGQNLERLSSLGKGHYEYITRENSDSKLILEAKGKRKK
jgi:Mg-chelatase subunit ChlD